jgi:hypothetical protein
MEMDHVTIYSHITVNIWLYPKYRCIRDQNYSCGTNISKFHLDYLELCDECSNFSRMYTLTLLK